MRVVTLLVMTVIACDGSSGIAPDAFVDPAPIDAAIDGCTVSTAPSSARHTKHVATAQTQGYWEYLPADYGCAFTDLYHRPFANDDVYTEEPITFYVDTYARSPYQSFVFTAQTPHGDDALYATVRIPRR